MRVLPVLPGFMGGAEGFLPILFGLEGSMEVFIIYTGV